MMPAFLPILFHGRNGSGAINISDQFKPAQTAGPNQLGKVTIAYAFRISSTGDDVDISLATALFDQDVTNADGITQTENSDLSANRFMAVLKLDWA